MVTTDPDGRSHPLPLRRRWAVAAFLVLVCVAVVAWLWPSADPEQTGGDLLVYRGAIDSMLHGTGLYEYAKVLETGPSPFLYPPFAALVMLPTQAIPLGSVITAWILIQLVMTVVLVLLMIRDARWRGRITVPVVAWTLVLLSGPVMFDLNLGQISLLIMLLSLADVMLLPRRWRGTLIGLAGAMKLTPMFFVVYFLITRQWRAAVNASATFAASALAGFVALPHQSVQYWTSVVFKTSRIPDLASPRNLTIYGDLKLWHVPDSIHGPLWALLALTVAVLALRAGWRHHRGGEPVAAIIVVGLATTAIGPIAWDHHLVWLAAAGLYLVFSGSRRVATAGWVLLAVCILPSPIWPHEEDPVLWRQLLGMVPLLLTIFVSVRGLPAKTHGAASPREPDEPVLESSAVTATT